MAGSCWEGCSGAAQGAEAESLGRRPGSQGGLGPAALTSHGAAFPQAAGTRLGPRFRVSLYVGEGRSG